MKPGSERKWWFRQVNFCVFGKKKSGFAKHHPSTMKFRETWWFRETIQDSTHHNSTDALGRRVGATRIQRRCTTQPSFCTTSLIMTYRLPSTRYVTVSSQSGHISYDGRSETSSAWRGGAAYVQMCLTCGLEPYRPGKPSNCLCVCGLGKLDGGSCSAPLQGHGDESGICRSCGGGRPEIHSIASTEVKPKRACLVRIDCTDHTDGTDVMRPADATTAHEHLVAAWALWCLHHR